MTFPIKMAKLGIPILSISGPTHILLESSLRRLQVALMVHRNELGTAVDLQKATLFEDHSVASILHEGSETVCIEVVGYHLQKEEDQVSRMSEVWLSVC